LDVDSNVKIEKYIMKIRKEVTDYDPEDPTFRKNVQIPKTAMGSNLNFELSSEPCFNTNLPTERDEDVETKLQHSSGMEMGEICSPDKLHIFGSETK
jgi:hypothetical protein